MEEVCPNNFCLFQWTCRTGTHRSIQTEDTTKTPAIPTACILTFSHFFLYSLCVIGFARQDGDNFDPIRDPIWVLLRTILRRLSDRGLFQGSERYDRLQHLRDHRELTDL